MEDKKSPARRGRRLWFNWPLVLGLMANFGLWIGLWFWFSGHKR